jgi:hypothetical protein
MVVVIFRQKGCRIYQLEINADLGQIRRWSCLVFVLEQIIRPWLLAVGTRVFPPPPLLAIPPPVLPRILQWQVSMVSCLGPHILIEPPPVRDSGFPSFVSIAARSVKPAWGSQGGRTAARGGLMMKIDDDADIVF